MRFLGVILAALMSLSVVACTATEEASRYSKQKVVYHINYPGGEKNKKWKGALKNVQNHINAVGADNLDLKVIIHSNGIFMLKEAKKPGAIQTAISNLKSQNISFSICANTIKSKKVPADQLFEVFDEDIVPSGVAELAHLQAQGYTYIKP